MNTHLAAQVSSGFTEVFGSWSSDALILILLLALFLAYGFFAGKMRLSSLIISLYLGAVAFIAFPYANNLSVIKNVAKAQSWSSLIIFIILVVIIHLILNRIILVGESFGKTKWLHLGELAASGVILVIGFFYTILPLFGKLIIFSANLNAFFHNPLTLFACIVLPVIALYTTNRN